MLWRDDPRGKSSSQGTPRPAWPRNGAVMRGLVHVLDKPVQSNTKWLEVIEFCQAGEKEFVSTEGCWMQFEQGGLLLHETA